MSDLLLAVAVPVPLPRLFDYRWPAEWPQCPQPGQRVLVEFGRRRLVGVVVRCSRGDGTALKPVLELLDAEPLFDPSLWSTLQWVARYYHAPLGETLSTALPLGMRRAASGRSQPSVVYALSVPMAAAGQTPARLGSAQLRLWLRLQQGAAAPAELAALHPRWRVQVEDWKQKGWVECIAVSPFAPPPVLAAGPLLNEEQAAAIAAMGSPGEGFAVSLLQGVTGSGKTEVYLRLLQAVVAGGGQGLLLVPEIGLTPQSIARLRTRLDARVAALHSELADGERSEVWQAAARGEVDVLVGTRSAVFAPLARLQLVVIDEEHDASYKQQDGIRYHARDVALMRAKAAGARVLLGSATPSLECLHNVERGRFQRQRLVQRVAGASLPVWRIVDMRRQPLQDGLAAESIEHIGKHLQAGGQVLVFKNRRGFAPTLMCRDCGWHAECPHCDVALTWHRQPQALRCHHCGWQQSAPASCPQCGGLALSPLGTGTERLEHALAARFPQYPLFRLDRDSTSRKHSFEAAMTVLRKGEPSLVVGTQMLAKGHHLPAVSLVVVVGVDEGLMSGDFRAGERLAQLLVQVAGRAGRAERPGQVLLQTHLPEHPLLRRLLAEGYDAVVGELLGERRALGLPPVQHAALIRAEHPEAVRAEAFLQSLLDGAAPGFDTEVDLAGPLSAPQARRQGRARFQLILLARDRRRLHHTLGILVGLAHAKNRDRKLRWSVDVDPVDFG